MESRHNDPTPVKCEDCGWMGKAMDCIHTYKGDGGEDVVPVDQCPKCNSESLIQLEGDLVLAG